MKFLDISNHIVISRLTGVMLHYSSCVKNGHIRKTYSHFLCPNQGFIKSGSMNTEKIARKSVSHETQLWSDLVVRVFAAIVSIVFSATIVQKDANK